MNPPFCFIQDRALGCETAIHRTLLFQQLPTPVDQPSEDMTSKYNTKGIKAFLYFDNGRMTR